MLEHRRRCPRYPFSSAAEVIDIRGKIRIAARTADIAKEGCYIDTISPFQARAAVALKITREAQSFETEATVVYSQIGMGMGLSFTTAKTEQLRMLETWLGELSGELFAESEASVAVPRFDAAKIIDHESRTAVSELILLLSRRNVITDSEGNAILQKLFK